MKLCSGRIFQDEEGLTTAGMAVALLVSLSLLMSAAQVYRINTASAEIQEVADAVALASENQVAEFMIGVRLADAVVFSLTLVGDAAFGLGVVASCAPPAAEIGAQLISTGKKILEVRDSFARQAAQGLSTWQRALPFMAAAQGAEVARANGAQNTYDYLALSVLLPSEGEEITVGSSEAEGAMVSAVEEEKDDLAEAAAQAEEAARQANEAKERGFAHDCGDTPSYCLYERAQHLAGLSAGENPLYTSVDSWSFSVALERARAYYPKRLSREVPTSDTVEEKARSALRKRFYSYAISALSEAYVHETQDSFDAYFPRLPRNTEQMRQTDLYTEAVYPITTSGTKPVMHAWEGCPNAGAASRYGSVKEWEVGEFDRCGACGFSASSLGSVASASTSINNGFEYHYNAIAEAAEDYAQARREAIPAKQAAQDKAQGLLDRISQAFGDASAFRIEASPPGASGCMAVVVATGGPTSGSLGGIFVSGRELGPRVAVAAATLIEDADEDASVIGDLLSGFEGVSSSVGVAGSALLTCWSAVLESYGRGTEGLIDGIEQVLDGLPLVGAAGLGQWAGEGLRTVIDGVGLDPVSTAPLKAVIASTAGVARADGGEYASRYLSLRERVLSDSQEAQGGIGGLAQTISSEAFDALAGHEIEVARIEIPVVNITVPLTVTLPPSVVEGSRDFLDQAAQTLDGLGGFGIGGELWE